LNHPAHQHSDRSARLDALTLDDWARVNIVGSSGSGKSTLSQKLADKLGHPPIEIDALFWGPNWTEPVDTEFVAKLEMALEPATWVLDGNYDRTKAIKWPRATMVIWLDLPYWQVLWQVFTRTMKRSLTQETLWSGNQESLRKAFFSRDSILLWSISNLGNIRQRYERAMQSTDYPHLHWIRLRSRRDIQRLLSHVEAMGNR